MVTNLKQKEMKQIKLSDTHYIVVDETQEIKEGEYCIDRDGDIGQFGDLSMYGLGYDEKNLNKITHSTQPIETNQYEFHPKTKYFAKIKEYPLSLAKEIAGEVDLSMRFILDGQKVYTAHATDPNSGIALGGFLRGANHGYNQCLEDNKDKKYTKEDMKKAYKEGSYGRQHMGFKEFIQSLQPPTEWEVEIVQGKLKRK